MEVPGDCEDGRSRPVDSTSLVLFGSNNTGMSAKLGSPFIATSKSLSLKCVLDVDSLPGGVNPGSGKSSSSLHETYFGRVIGGRKVRVVGALEGQEPSLVTADCRSLREMSSDVGVFGDLFPSIFL